MHLVIDLHLPLKRNKDRPIYLHLLEEFTALSYCAVLV